MYLSVHFKCPSGVTRQVHQSLRTEEERRVGDSDPKRGGPGGGPEGVYRYPWRLEVHRRSTKRQVGESYFHMKYPMNLPFIIHIVNKYPIKGPVCPVGATPKRRSTVAPWGRPSTDHGSVESSEWVNTWMVSPCNPLYNPANWGYSPVMNRWSRSMTQKRPRISTAGPWQSCHRSCSPRQDAWLRWADAEHFYPYGESTHGKPESLR